MKKPILVLSLLVAVFMAPGIVAYLYYLHPHWLSTKTNHGVLWSTPQPLHTSALPEKWLLLYWHPARCQQTCLKHLDELARVRLSLGRKLYYVDSFLASMDNVSQTTAFMQPLQQMDIHSITLTKEDAKLLGPKSAVYLVDKAHNVILRYTENQSPNDIYEDLKKMVKDA